MLILRAVSEDASTAWVSGLDSDDPGARRELYGRIVQLGVPDIELFAASEAFETAELEFRVDVRGEEICYAASFAHEFNQTHTIIRLLTIVLATLRDCPLRDLLDVRLAIYEICSNSLQHGVPADPDAQLTLELCICPSHISGSIRDGCEPFDVAGATPNTVEDRLEGNERRGYGLLLIRRALDQLETISGPDGNLTTFSKRIES